ncbi:MAG: hypothetical protein GQ532_12285 [Methylomarinum sp.]|nr:hypothetical protein [Methylomarinum sp.]
MGGMGSGSWIRLGSKATVDSQNTINIGYLKAQGLLTTGRSGELTWSCRGKRSGAIDYQTQENGIQLIYNYRSGNAGEWQAVVKQLIHYEYTACHYGGQRTWFSCPECHRRVTAIHGAGKYFLCRHCYGLSYQSQHESYIDHQLSKAQEIRVKLGGSASSASPLPSKPKGMHWQTYRRLQFKVIKGEMAFYNNVSSQLDHIALRMKARKG